MNRFASLFALLIFLGQTPALAQSLVGDWHRVGDVGPDMELTLEPDGGFVISWKTEEETLRNTGVWQRRGNVVIFRRDPIDVGPAYRLLSSGPWDQKADQAALAAQRTAMDAQMYAVCPWLQISDAVSAASAPRAEQPSPAEAREALVKAQLAADALSVAAERAAPHDGYADRAAIRHAIAEAGRFASAWGHAKALYSGAGLPLPDRPKTRMPDSCRPRDVSVASNMVAVHLVPSDGSQIDLSDDLTVAFRLPFGERQEALGADNWAFTSAGRGGPIEAVTFYGAGMPSETVPIPLGDQKARLFTIETDLQALANGPGEMVVSVRDNALFMYDGAVRFVRSETRGDTSSLAKRHDIEDSNGDPNFRLTDVGPWQRADRTRLLQASDDPSACSPGGITMAPLPGRPAAPNCEAKSDPESRFVAVDIGVPDGDIQPDGIEIAAITTGGKRFEAITRSGAALLPVATGTAVAELGVLLPDGRSAKLKLPEPWRGARYFRLTLNRAVLR